MINYTEPKLKDFKCFKLPIDELPKCKELLILGNVYNFFGTYKDGDLSDFTQTPWAGEGAASNFMNFGQFVMNGGHATIIASKETCNYYRTLYKEFYKAGFGTTHPKVVLFEIDDTKFLKGNFKIKDGKEEKLVKGEYFWAQGKDDKWEFNYPDFLESFFENGEKRMFDMIIANPPYGNKGTMAADIMNKITDLGKECVFLTPKTSFRYVGKTTFEKYGNFSDFFRGEDFFEGVSFTSKLVISHKSNQTKNPFKDYEDFASSHCKLYKSYRSFQLKNETDIKEIRLTFSTWHFTDEQVKDFTKNLPRERIFVATHRNVSNGVHINEKSFDIQYNLKGADFRKQTDCIAYEFKTKEERDNFTNWYYSTGKSGLAEYLSRLASYGGIVLHIWFPHIDWSYERTDENIISELKEKEVFPKNWNFDDFQEDNE